MKARTTMVCITAILLIAASSSLADEPAILVGEAAPAKQSPPNPNETPTLAAPLTPVPDPLMKPKLQPQSVVVVLINGNTITGTIGDADQWTMKTSFGTVNLPLSAVAGIRMAQEGNATTTVALHNGDTITGAVEFEHVDVQTDWGRAEILGTHVASILFTTGLKWASDAGLNGVRWKLVAADPRPAATNASAPAVAAQPRGAVPTRQNGRP